MRERTHGKLWIKLIVYKHSNAAQPKHENDGDDDEVMKTCNKRTYPKRAVEQVIIHFHQVVVGCVCVRVLDVMLTVRCYTIRLHTRGRF